jgi:hypothetical protein
MKYKLNNRNRFGAFTSPTTYILILAGILTIFSLYVAYNCSETARDRLYPMFEYYEDGSFIMIDKQGNTKIGCMSEGVCND